jgi:hypothetical protein
MLFRPERYRLGVIRFFLLFAKNALDKIFNH